MTFQFSTRTLFLTTSFIAATLAGATALFRATGTPSFSEVGLVAIIISPLWNPLVWAAYAIGRQKLTVAIVVTFVVFEASLTLSAILLYQP